LFFQAVSPSPSDFAFSLQAAALDIAMIKMVAPSMAYRVIDRAIQVSTGQVTWFV
jgi:alkylation response protein AidB-like acyl-CoA dehydrogenase